MSTSKIPRLKDVAAAAKVSLSAASRILRGERERFGDDTCQRVLDAARELGWRRNLLVSGMQTGRTRMIGIMIPPYDSFWVDVLAGIHMVLAEADYLPITVWVGDCQEMPRFEKGEDEGFKQISRLLDRRVDGLILWPSFAVAYYDHFREVMEHRVPVVVIDHYHSEAMRVDSIETDEEASVRQVVEHLVSLGHKRLACLSSREAEWQAWSVRRRECFVDSARSYPDVEVHAWRLNPWGSDGLEVARQILQATPPWTAVFAVTDHEAQYLYEAAAELGKSIPRDVSIVGFADLDFAASMRPPLTTMRQRPREIGRRAAQRILDRLQAESVEAPPTTTIRVGAELIVRKSTARPVDEAK